MQVSLALDLELQKALETKFHFLPMGDASVSSSTTAAGGAITRLTQVTPQLRSHSTNKPLTQRLTQHLTQLLSLTQPLSQLVEY